MCRKTLLTLIVILAGLFLPGKAQAQANALAEPLYIVLVMDDSGSMESNDSQNLRVVAAKLLRQC
jgi:hypothetical protein